GAGEGGEGGRRESHARAVRRSDRWTHRDRPSPGWGGDCVDHAGRRSVIGVRRQWYICPVTEPGYYSPGIGAVTRRSVRLIRPPSGNSVDVPGMIRSTPWNAKRALPPSTTASPEARRMVRDGSLRLVPPIRNRQVSPSESEMTGASKSCSSRS